MAEFKYHNSHVTSVEWSSFDSTTLATAAADNQVQGLDARACPCVCEASTGLLESLLRAVSISSSAMAIPRWRSGILRSSATPRRRLQRWQRPPLLSRRLSFRRSSCSCIRRAERRMRDRATNRLDACLQQSPV